MKKTQQSHRRQQRQQHRQAKRRQRTTACKADASYQPLDSPVAPDLIAQGCQQREAQRPPIVAQKLADVRQFKEVLERVLTDAPKELPLPVDDPIQAMAQGKQGA
jgi:hypothetical protein